MILYLSGRVSLTSGQNKNTQTRIFLYFIKKEILTTAIFRYFVFKEYFNFNFTVFVCVVITERGYRSSSHLRVLSHQEGSGLRFNSKGLGAAEISVSKLTNNALQIEMSSCNPLQRRINWSILIQPPESTKFSPTGLDAPQKHLLVIKSY